MTISALFGSAGTSTGQTPRLPVGIMETDPSDARQLQVRDLEDPDISAAMSVPNARQPTWSLARRIAEYEERYRGVEVAVFVVPVWLSPEGPVIIDGNHRACALYRVSPPTLDVDVIAFQPPPDCYDVLGGPRS